MLGGLVLPAMALGFLAWLVPKIYSMVLPEGAWPLVLNAVLSAFTLAALAAAFFLALYLREGIPLDRIVDLGLWGNAVFFGRLSASTALIWGPIMVLSLAALPRTWVRAVW
ncbi:hypothetical protein EU805_00845 [Salipiger sp. IMCC34102]|uniref:hypothetical protein n=1 Tax=Salipiger sp. IMCC34102 TaxID=2510647 RepID=UPI00101C23C9|nr:hypothetical protein [Salipiger sp. IMCC34102]RYH03951.1 hypothetical protein EU805_00845 [Salipiger sp. IMCC34102]